MQIYSESVGTVDVTNRTKLGNYTWVLLHLVKLKRMKFKCRKSCFWGIYLRLCPAGKDFPPIGLGVIS